MIKLETKLQPFDEISVLRGLELLKFILYLLFYRNYGQAYEDCRHGMFKNKILFLL